MWLFVSADSTKVVKPQNVKYDSATGKTYEELGASSSSGANSGGGGVGTGLVSTDSSSSSNVAAASSAAPVASSAMGSQQQRSSTLDYASAATGGYQGYQATPYSSYGVQSQVRTFTTPRRFFVVAI